MRVGGTNPFNGSHSNVPIYLIDGATKIADGNADLWDGTLDHALTVNETGGNGSLTVRTGTEGDGAATPLGSGGALGSTVSTNFGFTTASGADWIAAGTLGQTVSLHFYALSDVIVFPTKPVTGPGIGAVLALGIAIIGLGRRRRGRDQGWRCAPTDRGPHILRDTRERARQEERRLNRRNC